MTLIVRPEMRHYQLLDLLLEFKLVKLAEAGLTGEQVLSLDREQLVALPAVQARLAEARSQLQRYRTALEANFGERLRLRTHAVVGWASSGWCGRRSRRLRWACHSRRSNPRLGE